jgi:phage-related protein
MSELNVSLDPEALKSSAHTELSSKISSFFDEKKTEALSQISDLGFDPLDPQLPSEILDFVNIIQNTVPPLKMPMISDTIDSIIGPIVSALNPILEGLKGKIQEVESQLPPAP